VTNKNGCVRVRVKAGRDLYVGAHKEKSNVVFLDEIQQVNSPDVIGREQNTIEARDGSAKTRVTHCLHYPLTQDSISSQGDAAEANSHFPWENTVNLPKPNAYNYITHIIWTTEMFEDDDIKARKD